MSSTTIPPQRAPLSPSSVSLSYGPASSKAPVEGPREPAAAMPPKKVPHKLTDGDRVDPSAPLAAAKAPSVAFKKRPYQKGDTITVIGAGVGGLSAVLKLIEKGVDPTKITVIEREPQAGGKVRSFDVTEPNGVVRTYELGAAVAIPTYKKYDEFIARAAQAGNGMTALKRGTNFSLTSGKAVPPPSSAVMKALIAQYETYLAKYAGDWKGVDGPNGYQDMSDELEKTWPELQAALGIQGFGASLDNVVGKSGYSHPLAPPAAAYPVRFLSPTMIASLMKGGVSAFTQGFQNVWKDVAADLERAGVTFRFGTTATEIDRQKNKVKLKLDDGTLACKNNSVRMADHVIYTADYGRLGTMLADATPAEKTATSMVKTYDYRTYLVRINGLPDQKMSAASSIVENRGGGGRPILWVKPFPDTNVYAVYAYGADTKDGKTVTFTDDEIKKNIVADFAKLGGTIPPDGFITSKTWQYFPHVKGGVEAWYAGVSQRQGGGGLHVATEADSFGITTSVSDRADYVAEMLATNGFKKPNPPSPDQATPAEQKAATEFIIAALKKSLALIEQAEAAAAAAAARPADAGVAAPAP